MINAGERSLPARNRVRSRSAQSGDSPDRALKSIERRLLPRCSRRASERVACRLIATSGCFDCSAMVCLLGNGRVKRGMSDGVRGLNFVVDQSCEKCSKIVGYLHEC